MSRIEVVGVRIVQRLVHDSAASASTSSPSSIALTGPIEAGDIETERKPMPSSAIAESGLPAISPQSVTGV